MKRNGTRLGLALVAALLSLGLLAGNDGGSCIPTEPVEPACVDDADCGAGAFCDAQTGECVDFAACAYDSDCVEVRAGCCPCSMGGQSTAIHVDRVDEWLAQLDCPIDIACLAVYLCQDWTPACVNGMCTLQGGGIGTLE